MERTIKRILAVCVSVLLAFSLFACSAKTQSQSREELSNREADPIKDSAGNVSSASGSDAGDYSDDGYSDPGDGSSPRIISNDGTFYGEWLDDGQYGVKYQGADGYIIAIFNADGTIDHFKEYDNTGDLQWSCDWYFYDERDQEHSFCVGYEHSDVYEGETRYYDSIFADYDLDYCLEWPNEYYENDSLFAERNQQYVTVDNSTFTLWWRSMIYLNDTTYYYEFEDTNYSFAESSN